jgi:hypothetical protein
MVGRSVRRKEVARSSTFLPGPTHSVHSSPATTHYYYSDDTLTRGINPLGRQDRHCETREPVHHHRVFQPLYMHTVVLSTVVLSEEYLQSHPVSWL